MESDLYKNRSISGCIKVGYLLFRSNVMTILCKNWLSLLVFSIMGSVYLAFGLTSIMHTVSNSLPTGKLVAFGLLNVLLLYVSVWCMARTTTLLNENGFACNLKCDAKLQLAYVVVMGVISLLLTAVALSISYGQKPASVAVDTTGMGLQAWLFPVAWLIILITIAPFAYSSMRYIQEKEAKFKTHVLGGYRIGLRRIGFIVSTFFLYGIVIFFLALILLISVYIPLMASTLSQMGVQSGDLNTLPTYFPLLTYGTCILIYFICATFLTVGIYVNYHVYGSIEARRQAQSNRKAIQTEAAEASNGDGH